MTFILDVIDLWPESYFVFFKKFDFLIKLFLFPWTLVSKLTYRQSTLVIAESKEYARYVSKFRKDKVVGYYLGVNVEYQKELIKNSTAIMPVKRDDEIWITYGGALNNSYDFDVILTSFIGIQKREAVFNIYKEINCLLFPSKLETWGLPLSEFKIYNKPIIAADLPYAKETLGDYRKVCFFNPDSSIDLANRMLDLINKKLTYDTIKKVESPDVIGWSELLNILIN